MRLREYDVEPVKGNVKVLWPQCDWDLSKHLEMIPPLLHMLVEGGFNKDSSGDREVAYDSLALLQDGILEVKKKLVQANAVWNKQ